MIYYSAVVNLLPMNIMITSKIFLGKVLTFQVDHSLTKLERRCADKPAMAPNIREMT